MDYSNDAGTEIIESLDFLRPPVKRLPEKTWNDKKPNAKSFIQTHKGEIRQLYKNIPKDITYSKAKDPITPSTSLIDKRTFGRYSLVSYTTLLHPTYRKDHAHKCPKEDKPLIKVTVIPKSQQTQTGRLHRKPEHNTKIVQRTVSNHENSFQPKKLFLIVTGEKEKIYEIKPSESAQLSCKQIDGKLVDGKNDVKDIKELIKSLDMDKKKSKNKKNKINTNQNFEIDGIAENSRLFKECNCNEFAGFDVDRIANAQASRVRISGRVGLTEDEEYILNCTATVDNKPITTISKPIGNSTTQIFFTRNDVKPKDNQCFNACNRVTGCNNFNNNNKSKRAYNQNCKTCGCVGGRNNVNIVKSQRDSNIQVDFENINCNAENATRLRSNKSQSTQVDFNIQLPNIDVLRTQNKDERNQCNCNNLDNIISTLGKEADENTLRTNQSPLVIISVYPKQETSGTTKTQKEPATENSWQPQWSGKNITNGKSKRQGKGQIDNIKSNQGSPGRSRSPSPNKNYCGQRNQNNNSRFETRIVQTTTRKGSPSRQFKYEANKMTQNKQNIKQQTKFFKNKTDTCNTQNQEIMNRVLRTREPKTVQAQLKKSLVDDYIKLLTGNKNGNFGINDPKNKNSRGNIKGDRDNKNYDLFLNQGKLKTDLKIGSTVKETGSQKYEDNRHRTRKVCSNTEPTRRKVSPVKQIYQNNNGVMDFPNHTSTLNARDSIEIFHRRETNYRIKDTGTRKSANERDHNENNTEFFAPIKHYRGDDCELPNPVERDKQIRELLGIVKGIPTTSKQEHKFGSVSEDHSMIQCFYRKTCNKNLETGLSLYKLYSCCYINDKTEERKNCEDNKNEYSQKNIGIVPSVEETSLYQQLILNRNIQVFLQVEQFSKQKPIILSRKQYNKVKKAIQKTISRRLGQGKRKNSIISVGEVRKRTKTNRPLECEYAKHTQTQSSVTVCNESKEDGDKNSICSRRKSFEKRQIQTVVLFDSKKTGHNDIDIENKSIGPEKRTFSSLEIRYTNVAYMNNDTFSSTNVGSLSSTSFNQRNNSLYTIFKDASLLGNRKSATPNLGTSVFSLLTNCTKSKYFETSSSTPDIKVKKPFLRRLMSCLVMQSRISDKKIPTNTVRKTPRTNSSVDSYHINTSLGAIEMTSSVYDTSASFYSNHAICPGGNNKIKRGFLSSVRGFWTSRRSRSFIFNPN